MATLSFAEQNTKLNYAAGFKRAKKTPTSILIPLNHFNVENLFSAAWKVSDIDESQGFLNTYTSVTGFVLQDFPWVLSQDESSRS